MSSRRVELAILKALRHIRDHREINNSAGICLNMRKHMHLYAPLKKDDWARLKETQTLLFMSWGKFSGNADYPIPHPTYSSPVDGYNCCCKEHIWDHEHPYGALRWEMVHHMIKKLEEKYP